MNSSLSALDTSIFIVISEFNKPIIENLLQGSMDAFLHYGGIQSNIHIYRVPGAFEIPATTKMAAKTIRPDAIVTLGAVIKGETKHFDFIASECTRAIQDLTLLFDIPIIFGVLTTENAEQALERSEKKDKGYEVMESAFKMIQTFKDIKTSSLHVLKELK